MHCHGHGHDAFDEIVIAAFLFDDSGSLVAEHADFFVADLAVTAGLDHRHDDILGRHEWQFLA